MNIILHLANVAQIKPSSQALDIEQVMALDLHILFIEGAFVTKLKIQKLSE